MSLVLPILSWPAAAQYPAYAYLLPTVVEINLQPETLALTGSSIRVEQVVDARPDGYASQGASA